MVAVAYKDCGWGNITRCHLGDQITEMQIRQDSGRQEEICQTWFVKAQAITNIKFGFFRLSTLLGSA